VQWDVLEYPAYSLDLSACDFHIFGPLNKALEGHMFMASVDVQEAVVDIFRQ
jgi:hypothetical protein